MRLEPLGPAHVGGVERLVADPEVLRFTLVPDPPPPGFAATWVQRYVDGRDAGERVGFAGIDETLGFLGVGLVFRIDREAAEAELGYMTVPEARGRGAATALLRAATRYAFDELGTLRATLVVNVENRPSQRVAARAGYTLEGVMRSVAFKQGRRTDAQLWSRLPSDPEPPAA